MYTITAQWIPNDLDPFFKSAVHKCPLCRDKRIITYVFYGMDFPMKCPKCSEATPLPVPPAGGEG